MAESWLSTPTQYLSSSTMVYRCLLNTNRLSYRHPESNPYFDAYGGWGRGGVGTARPPASGGAYRRRPCLRAHGTPPTGQKRGDRAATTPHHPSGDTTPGTSPAFTTVLGIVPDPEATAATGSSAPRPRQAQGLRLRVIRAASGVAATPAAQVPLVRLRVIRAAIWRSCDPCGRPVGLRPVTPASVPVNGRPGAEPYGHGTPRPPAGLTCHARTVGQAFQPVPYCGSETLLLTSNV